MNVLLTGGSGFIGSNILESLILNPEIEKVRILDNLSTGSINNISNWLDHPKVVFFEGDIRNEQTCLELTNQVQIVCHQAALGSVPRSINAPINTYDNNTTGFQNILEACRINGVKKVAYASSSSVYGDAVYYPKIEEKIGKPLSPYAASKYANEIYAEVYAKCYGIQIAGFRYFNVFGPNQNPDGPYAAVIPLFIKHALNSTSPTINGDGTITRDFTFVSNVVKANLNFMLGEPSFTGHEVFNIACGKTSSLLHLWTIISELVHTDAKPIFGPNRSGDILHSLADISKASNLLNYTELVSLEAGLLKTIEYYKK
jgi:UDP-N-acetylglucosamine 4-epimerase